MQERAVKKNQVLEIVISDMAFGGVGIGKLQTDQGEFAVFVQNAIPGQRVLARVEKAQKRFAECKLIEVLQLSPDEVALPYQAIPGAPYATLPIELQRKYKHRTTLELFRRIGKIETIQDVFDEYDFIIINDELNNSYQKIRSIIEAKRVSRYNKEDILRNLHISNF